MDHPNSPNHPFFDSLEYPWSRSDAVNFYDLLCRTIKSKTEIELLYQKTDSLPGTINWDQGTNDIWHNILNELTETSRLKELCKLIEEGNYSEKLVNSVKQVIKGELVFQHELNLFKLKDTLLENLHCTLYYKKKDETQIVSFKLPEKKEISIKFPEDGTKIKTSNAFKGSESYFVKDCYSFVGRKEESDFLTREILENGKNPVIIGEPFIGKTSLINAGIIASILKTDVSFLIVQIERHDKFFQTISQIIKFFDNNPNHRKLLVLDQFEEIVGLLKDYELDHIAEKFNESFSKNIQLILSSRSDESRHKIASINNKCNGKLKFYGLSAVEKLKYFSQDECDKILSSINKKTGEDFELDSFKNLVKDCFQIEESVNEISPLVFQIVCFGLQETLKLTPLSERKEDFYNKNNAFFFLEDYVRSALNGNLADIGADSSEILSLINTNAKQNDLSMEQIIEFFKETKKDTLLESTKIEAVLNRLEKEKLIFKRKEKNLYKYSLTIPSFDRIAKNLINDSLFKELLTANQILHSKWHLSELAESNDLQLFRKYQDNLDLDSSKLFFLLRSSFEKNEPLSFWYEKLLAKERGQKFLENIFKSPNSDNFYKELFIKLFQDKNSAGVLKENDYTEIEAYLKNKAATSDNLPVRQTAIVALRILQGKEFRFDSLSRAEVLGTLSDYLPDYCNKFKFTALDRFISWNWRVIRRIQISTFSLYDAVISLVFIFAGGLVYALSRSNFYDLLIPYLILSIIVTSLILMPLVEIFILLFMFVAKFSQIKSLDKKQPEDENLSIFSDILAIIIGAVVFGFVNFVCNFFTKDFPDISEIGLGMTILWCFLGLVAGTGIGLGLKVQKVFSKKPDLTGFIVGAIVTAGLFSFVQFSYEKLFSELSLVLSGSVLEALFAGFSFYLGLFYITLRGKIFNEIPNKINS